MQNDNLYKKLRIIFLVLAIISMIFALSKKVHANAIPADEVQEFDDAFYDYINNTFGFNNINIQINANNIEPDTSWNYTEITNSARNNTPNMILGWFTNEPEVDLSNFHFADWTTPYSLTWYTPCQRGSTYDHVVTSWSSENIDWQNVKIYFFIKHFDSQIPENYCCYLYKVNLTNRSQISYQQGKYVYHYNVNYNLLYREKHNNFGYNDYIDDHIIVSNMNAYTYKYYNYNQTFGYYENNTGNYWFGIDTFKNTGTHLVLDHRPNTNTDGFVVYKQSIHNHDFLMIDFSKCINWSYATNSDYYLGNSSFDIYIDGNKETIELDDNTYYTYDSSKQKAYFQIPVTFFNAYGYENATNVYINNVNINYGIIVGMPMNFEANYITDVYLKKANNINFEPDDTQLENEIAYQDNIAYVEQYNDYIAYNDTSFNMEYTIDQPLYATIESAKASINGTAKTFTIQTWYDSEDTNKIYFLPLETTTSDRIELWDYIANNPFALYCDVLIVQVKRYTLPTSYNSNTPWEYTHDVGAMVIYTQRYYIRNSTNGILTSLVDITEYEKITSQYTYWLYDLAYDKLTNMDNNMSVYFNSSLDVINNILETLDNINNSLSNLDDILNKIFDALKDLNISQLDGIDSKLSTIIDNISSEASVTLNEDDTVAEAIQYYRSHNNNGVPTSQVYIDDKMSIWISGKVHLWLQGTDANTDKTNMINSVFDTLTSIYDSMKNNNDIFPNIQYYLDAIAKNNEYGYETHGDYMTRLFKGNVDISTYDGISE